jgi:purine-binding chemotaxis protein CheW
MPETEYTKETCTIVVDVQGLQMGIVVDTVSEVLDIAESDIEPPPAFGSTIKTDFILGMGKVKEEIKILLSIDKILSAEEFATIAKAGT